MCINVKNVLRRCFANKRCSDDENGKKLLHFWLTPLTRVIFPLQLSFIRRFDVCFKREYFSDQNFGRIRRHSLLSWKKPRAWKDAGFSSRRFSESIALLSRCFAEIRFRVRIKKRTVTFVCQRIFVVIPTRVRIVDIIPVFGPRRVVSD